IAAIDTFYSNSQKRDHDAGADAYTRAMEQMYQRYTEDREAAAFYALSLLASEPHHDSTFANRKKAGAVLERLFEEEPNHPGVSMKKSKLCVRRKRMVLIRKTMPWQDFLPITLRNCIIGPKPRR